MQEIIINVVLLIMGLLLGWLLKPSKKFKTQDDLTAWEKKYYRPIYESQIDNLNNEISMLRSKVEQFDRDIDPIVQERKKAEKLKAMKSFNKWKMINVHEEEQCAECFGKNISLQRVYSQKIDGFYTKSKPYPIQAVNKCNDCGHVISEWKLGGHD